MIERVSAIEPLPLMVVRPGRTPVLQGEPADGGPWVVEAGVFSAWLVGDDHRPLWLDLLGPGDGVGPSSGGPSPWTVTALSPARLRCIGPGRAAQLADARQARLAAFAADLASLDVTSRVERRLTDLARRFGRAVPDGVMIPMRLPQEQLGALAGTSRESANRALQRLMAAGRVSCVRRCRYVVHQPLRVVS